MMKVDNSKFSTHKYERGSHKTWQQVFWGVERESRNTFLVVITNCVASTLTDVISGRTEPGTQSYMTAGPWHAYTKL